MSSIVIIYAHECINEIILILWKTLRLAGLIAQTSGALQENPALAGPLTGFSALRRSL